MSEYENLAIIREAYARWNDSGAGEDSVAHWISLLDDEVNWQSLANGAEGMAFTRACHCKNDVIRYFTELAVDWELVHYTVDELISSNDRVVMLGHCGWRHRGTAKVVETPKADFLRMRDGKIIEFQEFYDTAQAIAATR